MTGVQTCALPICYTISKEGEDVALDLIYNNETDTWNVVTEDQVSELLKMNNDGTAQLYLPNGTSTTVTLDAQGILAAHQLVESGLYFAAR